jgi:hypothetical protein
MGRSVLGNFKEPMVRSAGATARSELLHLDAELVEFMLKLRHALQLEIQFMVDPVDVLVNLSEQRSAPHRLLTLGSDITLEPPRTGWTRRPWRTWRTGRSRDALQTALIGFRQRDSVTPLPD